MHRNRTLILAVAIVFMVVSIILNRLLPGPLRPTDYLVIGGGATMVCLLVLFVILLTTHMPSPDPFYSRRRKPQEGAAEPRA